MSVGEWIAIAGLTLNFLIAVVGLTWGAGKIRDTVRKEVAAHQEKSDGALALIERRFGETCQALRQKIADVELYAANNYVRRDGFYKVQEQLTAEFRVLRESIEARFVRVEEQISHLRGQ